MKIEKFEGYDVPEMTKKQLRYLDEHGMYPNGRGLACGITPIRCSGIDCPNCILYQPVEVFKRYLKKRGMATAEALPEIKPGMLVRFREDRRQLGCEWVLLQKVGDKYASGYCICPTKGETLEVCGLIGALMSSDFIECYQKLDETPMLVRDILQIMRGSEPGNVIKVYSKEEAAVEMTVEDVEKLVGKKVKIVGGTNEE